MATERHFECECGHSRCISLFDALRDFQKRRACAGCGQPKRLHLTFPFEVGVGPTKCEVLAAFLPRKREQWHDRSGKLITFYPFLVVLKRERRKEAFWLPYWHDRAGTKLYGQWAPFMDAYLFRDLLTQARKADFVLNVSIFRIDISPVLGLCLFSSNSVHPK